VKRKWIAFGVAAVGVATGMGLLTQARLRTGLPWAEEALRRIDFARATPVTPELLAHNPLRPAAGIHELPATAQVAQLAHLRRTVVRRCARRATAAIAGH